MYTIKNEFLTVVINETGATLWSIKDKAGQEYLWQGNPKYWADRAPNIFPYVARLTEGKYTLQGDTYEMDIHGFAKDMIFKAEQISDSYIVFSISDTEETYKHGKRLELKHNMFDDDAIVLTDMAKSVILTSKKAVMQFA